MQHIRPLIFSFALLGLAGGLMSCAHEAPKKEQLRAKKLIKEKIFFASYDRVWRAAQLALKYPIAMNNMDSGVLETEFIKGDEGFMAPGADLEVSAGVKYKIALSLTKGKNGKQETVRVVINKTLVRQRDFFADAEPLVSDGLEERVIFYRIERELTIESALKKAASQN